MFRYYVQALQVKVLLVRCVVFNVVSARAKPKRCGGRSLAGTTFIMGKQVAASVPSFHVFFLGRETFRFRQYRSGISASIEFI